MSFWPDDRDERQRQLGAGQREAIPAELAEDLGPCDGGALRFDLDFHSKMESQEDFQVFSGDF